MRRVRRGAAVLAAVVVTAAAAAEAPAQPAWRSAQPAPPPGAPFSGPVGEVGDLQFLAPNLGLMLVGRGSSGLEPYGNGVLGFDGAEWRPIATVCGSNVGRIALAGPREWWTVTTEALRPASGQPITLCRFRDGAVVASYAVAGADVANQYARMTGAACSGPSNCWFGGVITDEPSVGTFLLHWDGAALRRIVHPAARGIADLQADGGTVLGATVVGAGKGEITAQSASPLSLPLVTPDAVDRAEVVDPLTQSRRPRLLRVLGGDGGVTVPAWAPRTDAVTDVQGPGFPTQLVDGVALDGDGSTLWVAGRGSQSATRPRLPGDPIVDFNAVFPDKLNPVSQKPFLAVRRPGQALPQEVEWKPTADIRSSEVIHDIAAIPGTSQAWLVIGADVSAGLPSTTSRTASIARVTFAPGAGAALEGDVLERVDITRPDVIIGDAAKIDCSAAEDCWLATANGWIYRWSDPAAAIERNTDPIFGQLIKTRPPDGRTPRDDPDTIPADEAASVVAPVVEADAPAEQPQAKQIAALFRVLGKPKVRKVRGRYVIELRIQLRRKARVQLVGRRGGRVVARTKTRTLKKGRHTLRLSVRRKRWPTALRFVTKDLEITTPAPEEDLGGDADDIVTTG